MCIRDRSGIEDKEVREQVQKLVEEKYSDRMYQYYTGIADSVGNLSSNTYQYATDVQEVRRYLKAVSYTHLRTAYEEYAQNKRLSAQDARTRLVAESSSSAKTVTISPVSYTHLEM